MNSERLERYVMRIAGFFKRRAPVEEGLAPDPRLITAAHLRFHGVNRAEVPGLRDPLQERTDRDILSCFGMAQLEGDDITEVSGGNIPAVHRIAVLHGCNEPSQYIRTVLPDPDIHICRGWRDTGAEDPAAEPGLFTGFVIQYQVIHDFTIH